MFSKADFRETAIFLSDGIWSRLLEIIWEDSAEGMRVVDSKGRMIAVNKKFCELVEMTAEELAGNPLSIVYAESEREHILKRYRERFEEKGFQTHFEGRMTLWNGRDIEVSLTNSLITSEDGQEFLFSVYRDITEKRNIERQLQQKREEQEKILDSVPAMIFYKDTENRIIQLNSLLARELGKPKEQIAGKRLEELLPRHAGKYRSDDREVITTGKPKFNILEQLETVHGLRWVKTDKIPYRNDNGEIIGVIGFAIDITERREAEQALLRERTHLEVLLKHEKLISDVASGLHSTEPFMRVIPGFLRIISQTLHIERIAIYTTHSKSKRLRFLTDTLVHMNEQHKSGDIHINLIDFPRFKELLETQRTLTIQSTSELEEDKRAFFSEHGIASAHIVPIALSEAHQMLLFFCNFQESEWLFEQCETCTTLSRIIANAWERDHHFQARIEAEIKHIDMMHALEKASNLASIGVIAAGITHEINQPLNAIKVVSDSVLYWDKKNRGYLPQMIISKLEKISAGVDRIDQIVKHMRTFYSDQQKKPDEIFDLNDAVRHAISFINRQIGAHDIELELNLDERNLDIRGNVIHVEQMLLNLVANAIHALDQSETSEKKIVIRSRGEEGHAILEIRDTGPGVPPGQRKTIFDPFYTTKHPDEGMGIGLAIVKRIVEEHMGKIAVKNHRSGGALFTVRVPIVKK